MSRRLERYEQEMEELYLHLEGLEDKMRVDFTEKFLIMKKEKEVLKIRQKLLLISC